jgi:cytochrome c-type biogenesis protein CcmH
MIFWIAVIGLLLLALLILLPPILKAPPLDQSDNRQQQNIDIAKDKKTALDAQLSRGELNQSEYDSALLDLQTALAIDLENNESTDLQPRGKWVVWPLGLILPLLSLGLYFQIGEYRVIEKPALAQVHMGAKSENQQSNLSFGEMQELLVERLRDNPENAQDWFMLGRTYMAQQKFDPAITAYQRTLDLVGEEPGVLFSLADALAMNSGGVMQGEPESLVSRGLKKAPRDPTGLWLMGLAAEQRQDYRTAHDAWTTLLPLIQDDARSVKEVRGLIHMVEQRDPTLVSTASDPVLAQTETSGERSLSLSVNLAEPLRQIAAPQDAVFIYAKAMSGPPMPLAVKRLTVADLPVRVTLRDSDAMIPSMTLSAYDQVVVGARISKSGNPVAQTGDLFVEVSGVDSSNPPKDMVLTINQVK